MYVYLQIIKGTSHDVIFKTLLFSTLAAIFAYLETLLFSSLSLKAVLQKRHSLVQESQIFCSMNLFVSRDKLIQKIVSKNKSYKLDL